MKTLKVSLGEKSYSINIGFGLISRAGELFNLNRRVLVVTDSGVPSEYSEKVASQCKYAEIVRIPRGEKSKSFEMLEELLSKMLHAEFDRQDCVCAVGGGVVGDLAGFASACYMRGIDFYNIPTTVLSQVDSSVGGKTAVNFCGVKNSIGAFHQPKGVIIDPSLLGTLPQRQISNGLAESLKMALTFDPELFEQFERGVHSENIADIITRSLELKIAVVEQDEKESGIRKALNFGHTVGHAIESLDIGLYHGECVSLGMLAACSEEVRERLKKALVLLKLPISLDFDRDKAYSVMLHDKKASGSTVTVVTVDKIGSYSFEKLSHEKLRELIGSV